MDETWRSVAERRRFAQQAEGTEDRCPPVPKALLDHLDRRYPNQCPDYADPERAIWAKTGARGVVDYLLAEYEHQLKNDQET